MARLDDIPEPTRSAVDALACPSYESFPFIAGPPLSARRVAVVSSAALIRRGDRPFAIGTSEFRLVPIHWQDSDILVSHVSINFDRTGFQRDLNVVHPVERLKELANEGLIGSVASQHYTVMGSTDPATMEASAREMAQAMLADRVDAVLLMPV